MTKYVLAAIAICAAAALGNIESLLIVGGNRADIDSIAFQNSGATTMVPTPGFGGPPETSDSFTFHSSVRWPERGVTIHYRIDGNRQNPFEIRQLREREFYELPAFLDGPPKIMFYTTTGLAAPGRSVALSRLNASPNPMTASAEVRFAVGRPGRLVAEVYDGTGRVVRALAAGQAVPGLHRLTWHRTDDAGRPVGPGVYFLRVALDADLALARLTVID